MRALADMVRGHSQSGWAQWVLPSRPLRLARYYLSLGAAGGLIGLALSLLVRMELQTPGLQYFRDPYLFNALVTAHGHTAIVFGAVPLLFAGFGSLIVPRGLAGDRLYGWPLAPLAFCCLAAGFAVYLVALVLAVGGVAHAPRPGDGWALYPPLAPAAPYTVPWMSMSSAELALARLGMGYLSMALMAVCFLATLLGRGGAGIPLGAVPPSVWGFFAASAMAIALLAVAGYETLRTIGGDERLDFGSTFFSTPGPWPFQHFANVDPAQPVLLISALAVASHAIEAAAGRSSLNARGESLAILLIGLGAFAIAALPVGWPELLAAREVTLGVSAATTAMLAVIGGLWLATVLRGHERRLVPALWVAGAVTLWACASGTVWLVATLSVDRALHDTYYVVASQHWSIMVAVCFAWFAGWYALFTEITGRRYLPWLAALQAVAALAGTALTFVPQLWLGLMGMPRRYADYPDAFATLNFYSSIGGYLALSSIILFLGVLLSTRRAAGPEDTRH